MRVLVTGSSGFIGRHLVATLRAGGHWVAGLDKREDHFGAENVHLVCDLLDSDRLAKLTRDVSADAIIHLAARTDLEEKQNLSGYAANVDGVRNLVSAMAATSSIRRCIFTSSQLVCSVGYAPRDDYDYCPGTLYGESKVRTEQIVHEADGGVGEWCLVRPTTVWGPGMNAHYQRFFGLIEGGRYFHIGNQPLYKSYGYVGNIAYQYMQLLNAPKEKIARRTFYLADYHPIDLIAWADAFQRALVAPRIRRLPKRLAQVLARVGDAINVLGFHHFPFTSFRLNNILTQYRVNLAPTELVCGPLPFSVEDGIRATVEWIRLPKAEGGGPRRHQD
jgi:nucleoside-diphosphate-sugar epimerase